VQTPKSDIFVAMLSIALGAIVLGCLLLILLLNRYNFQLKAAMTPDNRPALARLPADSLQSEFFRLYTCNLAGDSLEYSRPLELDGGAPYRCGIAVGACRSAPGRSGSAPGVGFRVSSLGD
jgi:hypothetical protein